MASPSLSQRFQGSFVGVSLGTGPEDLSQTWADRLQPTTQWLLQPRPHPAQLQITSAIDLLPLWLYGHENWHHRHQWLQRLDLPETDLPHHWAWGETLALVLKTPILDKTLPDRILDRWQAHAHNGAPACPPTWQTSLTQLRSQPSLTQILPWLQAQPPAQQSLLGALYLLITLCGSPSSALRRAQQLPHPESLSATGALIGAHVGLPLLPRSNRASPELINQARELFQDWAGFTPQARQQAGYPKPAQP
jgi:hypothetical protein